MYTFEDVDSKIATFLTECGNSFASNDLLLRTKCADILPKCVLSKKYAFCSISRRLVWSSWVSDCHGHNGVGGAKIQPVQVQSNQAVGATVSHSLLFFFS